MRPTPRIPALLFTTLALIFPAGAGAQPETGGATSKVVVYRGAGLVDTIAGIVRPDMSIVIAGANISKVVPTRELDAQTLAGAEVVEMAGRYAVAGLIDSHVHLATPPDRKFAEALLRRNLYGGVTAVRDMADDLRAVGELAREAIVGEIPAPDIYYAAFMAGPGWFADGRASAASQGAKAGAVPWMQEITAQTDVPIAVALARGTYATGIKIYADLPATTVIRITEEAHRQGIHVWAHGMVFPATPQEVVDAGVDVVSHACLLAYQASDTPPRAYENRAPPEYAKFAKGDSPQLAALFQDMHRRGTILDPTVDIGPRTEAAAAHAGKTPLCTTDLGARLTNQAYRERVLISSGTDSVIPPNEPYPELYAELALLAGKAGMSAAEVLKSATVVGAMTVGHLDDMGTIEPGKLANMVFLEKNPLQSISNLATVVLTVKRGLRYPRTDYRPIDPNEFPLEYRN